MSDDFTDIFYIYTNIYFHIFFNLNYLYLVSTLFIFISISQFYVKVKENFMNKIYFVHYNVVAMI